MKIYIVQGITGQIYETQSWLVMATDSEGKAHNLKNKLNKWLQDNNFYSNRKVHQEYPVSCPYDPNCIIAYGGTFYDVLEMELQ